MRLDAIAPIAPAKAEGWGHPLRAAKSHYFVDQQSLCGRWSYNGALTIGGDVETDCAICRKAWRERPAARAARAPAHSAAVH